MPINLAEPYHPERSEKIDIVNAYSQDHMTRQKTKVQIL